MKYKILVSCITYFILNIFIIYPALATRGCCSHHGGVIGCSANGIDICGDGFESPNVNGTCICTPPVSHRAKPKRKSKTHKIIKKPVIKKKPKKNLPVKHKVTAKKTIKHPSTHQSDKIEPIQKDEQTENIDNENQAINAPTKEVKEPYNQERLNSYLNYVWNRINFIWNNEKYALTNKGKATASFIINSDGSVSNVNLIQSSVIEEFDNLIKQIFSCASPLELPPPEYNGKPITMDFEVE